MIDSFSWLKFSIWASIIMLFGLASLLWLKTPELFDYFNMAFCAH